MAAPFGTPDASELTPGCRNVPPAPPPDFRRYNGYPVVAGQRYRFLGRDLEHAPPRGGRCYRSPPIHCLDHQRHCAGVNVNVPSTIGGLKTNLLRSSRLANRHRPLPSQYILLRLKAIVALSGLLPISPSNTSPRFSGQASDLIPSSTCASWRIPVVVGYAAARFEGDEAGCGARHSGLRPYCPWRGGDQSNGGSPYRLPSLSGNWRMQRFKLPRRLVRPAFSQHLSSSRAFLGRVLDSPPPPMSPIRDFLRSVDRASPSVRKFADSPLEGNGFRTFSSAMPRYRRQRGTPSFVGEPVARSRRRYSVWVS